VVNNSKMIVPFQVFLMLRMLNVHHDMKFVLTSELLVRLVMM